jgi:hypothetical protein
MFKAITDQRVVPYPATPPDAGCADATIVDPFCGNTLLRVTDPDINPTFPGRSYTTPSSSEAQNVGLGRFRVLCDRHGRRPQLPVLFQPFDVDLGTRTATRKPRVLVSETACVGKARPVAPATPA